jgi:hypothetical protein
VKYFWHPAKNMSFIVLREFYDSMRLKVEQLKRDNRFYNTIRKVKSGSELGDGRVKILADQ